MTIALSRNFLKFPEQLFGRKAGSLRFRKSAITSSRARRAFDHIFS